MSSSPKRCSSASPRKKAPKPTPASVQEVSQNYKFFIHDPSNDCGSDMDDVDDYFSEDRYLNSASSKILRIEIFDPPTPPLTSSQQQSTVAKRERFFVKVIDAPLSAEDKEIIRQMRSETLYSPKTFDEDDEQLESDDIVERWKLEVNEDTKLKAKTIVCENGVDRFGLILNRKFMFRFEDVNDRDVLEKEAKSFINHCKNIKKQAKELLVKERKAIAESKSHQKEQASPSNSSSKAKAAKKETKVKTAVAGKKK